MRPRTARARLCLRLAAVALIAGPCRAAVTLDPQFWDSYRPYQQYSDELIRELFLLEEGDLLETGRDIDGLELRIVGRSAPNAALISVRAVIDSVAMRRLQVKILPLTLSPNAAPDSRRRLFTAEQAQLLTQLLERLGFWSAPYRPAGETAGAACSDAGHWLAEAIRPGSYQLLARSDCGELDPIVADIRDYLLGLADIALD